MLKKRKTALIAAVIVIAALVAGWYFWQQRNIISTDDAQLTGQAIVIRPKVAGYIKKVCVKENEKVKKGQLLAEIDDKDYKLAYERQKAALEATQKALVMAKESAAVTAASEPAQVNAADDQIAAAKARLERAEDNAHRMGELIKSGACSQQDYVQAMTQASAARAELRQAQAGRKALSASSEVIAKANTDVKRLEAQVQQEEIALKQAKVNLEDTKIYAPSDGVITKKAIEAGSYVGVGTPLCSLADNELWVRANFKETQVRKIKPGDLVAIHVDAYPNMHLQGHVESFQPGTGSYFSLFPPENATGNFVKVVQRLPIKIVFDNLSDADRKLLKLGMSVEPDVYINGARP